MLHNPVNNLHISQTYLKILRGCPMPPIGNCRKKKKSTFRLYFLIGTDVKRRTQRRQIKTEEFISPARMNPLVIVASFIVIPKISFIDFFNNFSSRRVAPKSYWVLLFYITKVSS